MHAVQKKNEQRKPTTQRSTAKQKNESTDVEEHDTKQATVNLKMQIATIANRQGHNARICCSKLRKQKTKQAHHISEDISQLSEGNGMVQDTLLIKK